MKCVFILCSLLLSISVSATTLDSLRSEQRAEGLFVIHQVEEEETLYSIAKRYGGSVSDIIKHNQIVDNRIDIGQVIEVLVINKKEKASEVFKAEEGYHVVKQGETLYSIAKLYDLKVKELKKWNELESNAISLGMSLQVKKAIKKTEGERNVSLTRNKESETVNADSIEKNKVEVDPFADFEKYLVQTGETLSSIATKIGVSLDSLKLWNGLDGDYLKIGQPLMFREKGTSSEKSMVEKKTERKTRIDEDGFERIYEEGIASVIESMNTTRYLALHRSLPIGTNLKVRNLMNNQVVHVKVVGTLPDTGLNKDLLLRLSKAAYEQLGILDSKSRVEVSYYKL